MRRHLALALAAGLPLVLYLRTLSGASYWLDGGEFVAAAVNLDIAHPPGHPLTALYGKAWSLLPLGSLAFRLALGQAFAAALAAAFLYRACETTARALGLRSLALTAPLALLGTWLAVLGPAIWFQAIRPEVYALQACLLFLAMERLASFVADEAGDPRALYQAAFAVGLGLTNHHLMAFFMFPALLGCAGLALRRSGLRSLWLCAALGLLALCVYLYLPLRALREPPENLGDPRTLERIYWVVSAKVYARDMGEHVMLPLSERFSDVGIELLEQSLWVFLPAALLGVYATLRRNESRRLGLLWLLVAAPVLCIRPWLGSVRGNPDALAYLSAGLAACAIFTSAGLAAVAAVFEARTTSQRWWMWAPWQVLLLGVVMVAIVLRVPALDLSQFHATDLFDEYRERTLPPRSVLVATTPQTVFRELELAATEGVRRDLTLVPLPFLRYPGVAEALVARCPDLSELVAGFLASEHLESSALEHVAARRPLMLELDPHLAHAAYPRILPAGLLYAPVGARAAAHMLEPAAALQQRLYRNVYVDLGAAVRETETSRQLLWLHYMDALYYAARGAHVHARDSLARAARLYPHDAQLRALADALEHAEPGQPLDVHAFLSFDDAPPALR